VTVPPEHGTEIMTRRKVGILVFPDVEEPTLHALLRERTDVPVPAISAGPRPAAGRRLPQAVSAASREPQTSLVRHFPDWNLTEQTPPITNAIGVF
jgi:hypothetical protein